MQVVTWRLHLSSHRFGRRPPPSSSSSSAVAAMDGSKHLTSNIFSRVPDDGWLAGWLRLLPANTQLFISEQSRSLCAAMCYLLSTHSTVQYTLWHSVFRRRLLYCTASQHSSMADHLLTRDGRKCGYILTRATPPGNRGRAPRKTKTATNGVNHIHTVTALY